jgi:hypothetical protein
MTKSTPRERARKWLERLLKSGERSGGGKGVKRG